MRIVTWILAGVIVTVAIAGTAWWQVGRPRVHVSAEMDPADRALLKEAAGAWFKKEVATAPIPAGAVRQSLADNIDLRGAGKPEFGLVDLADGGSLVWRMEPATDPRPVPELLEGAEAAAGPARDELMGLARRRLWREMAVPLLTGIKGEVAGWKAEEAQLQAASHGGDSILAVRWTKADARASLVLRRGPAEAAGPAEADSADALSIDGRAWRREEGQQGTVILVSHPAPGLAATLAAPAPADPASLAALLDGLDLYRLRPAFGPSAQHPAFIAANNQTADSALSAARRALSVGDRAAAFELLGGPTPAGMASPDGG